MKNVPKSENFKAQGCFFLSKQTDASETMTQFRSHLIYLTHIQRSTSFAEFEGFAKGIMLLFPRVGDNYL